ncbi:choice-of-anchor L domain-containing protein [Altibacter sp.]|uniref:choice-of-anchor L domain-containing protein n=1 Tax=Altibacter sp. TaxID=2024823 RepID=UPI0025856B93|nr:choice-of-anchor L domain-containing protein [Altibacter sp.]MCW9037195.1 gliding motility-associated C-terminal domain-containing protein [Altibacter sp.]
MKIKLLILICLSSFITQAQSIVVNDVNDPQTDLSAEALIQEVLVSGSSCVDIELTNLADNPDGASNINERSWGYFRDGGSNFPFSEGIILSSGFAVSAEGPNDNTGTSDGSSLDWPGDVDIEAILNNLYGTTVDTNNATVFEFTFSSSLTEIDFEFIFASEEYEDQFECSDLFRDGFVFLLKGPGIPDDSGAPFGGTNIAAIEGSNNVLVSTATIHLDPADDPVNGFLCGGEVPGVNYFPEFYVSNDNDNTNDVPIQFDGLTASLTTATVSIVPNEIYTIKLVIADRGDASFDSAVFLKAGSFNIGNVDLGDDILLGSGDAVCENTEVTLDAGFVDGGTYKWFKDGVEIPNETSQTLVITETGLYSVEIELNNSECVLNDEILVEFFPNPEFDLGDDRLVCEDETIILDATVTNPGELSDLGYKWLKDGVEIPGETNSTLEVSETGTYSAVVTGNGCEITQEVFVEKIVFTVDIGDLIEPCGDSSYEIVPVIVGQDPANATYVWSTGETTPTITVTEDGVYSVEVTIFGCVETDDVTINFRTLPEVELGETIIKCAQDVAILNATPINADPNSVTYTWFLDGGVIEGATGTMLEVTEAGIYTVDINDDGCIGSDSIEITFYDNENCVITQGISPNGDGQNDFLDLTFLDDKEDIKKLSIFNRDGRIVYEKTEYINEWTGNTTDGAELPVGTYYYVIELNANDPVTGWIYLNK